MLTHVFFDFFGTLVDYSPSRTEQGFRDAHRVLTDAGVSLGYADYLETWDRVAQRFDSDAARSLVEFSMHDVCGHFLEQALDAPAPAAVVDDYIEAYLREWNTGVVYWPRLPDVLGRLTSDYRLGVITNTHHASLVPDHLERMGIAAAFDVVVTSVEHGSRKPHPAIFRDALDRVGARAEHTAYVGDSYEADYQGSRAAGIRPVLIDPDHTAPIPAEDRISHILDIERSLQSGRTGPAMR